jgi:hypothetical protein
MKEMKTHSRLTAIAKEIGLLVKLLILKLLAVSQDILYSLRDMRPVMVGVQGVLTLHHLVIDDKPRQHDYKLIIQVLNILPRQPLNEGS